MDRDEVLTLIRAHKSVLAQCFGVSDLALFGSTVCNEAAADSDIDILGRFDGLVTSTCYFVVQFYLEDLMGRPIDLITDKVPRPELRPYIEGEAVHV